MSTEKAGLVVAVRDCIDAIGLKSSASLSAGAAAKESADPRQYAAEGVRELPAEQSQDRDDAEHQDAHGKGAIPIEMARVVPYSMLMMRLRLIWTKMITSMAITVSS